MTPHADGHCMVAPGCCIGNINMGSPRENMRDQVAPLTPASSLLRPLPACRLPVCFTFLLHRAPATAVARVRLDTTPWLPSVRMPLSCMIPPSPLSWPPLLPWLLLLLSPAVQGVVPSGSTTCKACCQGKEKGVRHVHKTEGFCGLMLVAFLHDLAYLEHAYVGGAVDVKLGLQHV